MTSWKFFAFSKDDITAGYENFNEDKKMDFCLSIEDWQRTKFKVNLGPNVGDITISYDPPRRGRVSPNGGLHKKPSKH